MNRYFFTALMIASHSLFGLYTNPGLLFQKEGEWVGTDHLWQVPQNLTVTTEIITSEGVKLPFNEERVNSWIQEELKKVGIRSPSTSIPENPILHALVMVYALPNGYVAFIELRLFELVDLKRVKLDPGSLFQAITWENQTFILSPTEHVEDQVRQNVDSLVKTFADRIALFQQY